MFTEFQIILSDSVTYEWSDRDGRGGTVTFQYPSDKLPDTKDDILTFGFITPGLDAVLFRVDSRGGESHNDYLQMEIVSHSTSSALVPAAPLLSPLLWGI